MKAWITNPWGKPRFLVLFTWLFIVWSIVPIIIAIAFSFNDGRSRTAWQGFSLRWFYHDPLGSVWQDDALRSAMWHSLELACFAMLIATPLGVALAIGLQRWQSKAGTAANNRREPFAPPATAGVSLDPWTPASPLAPHVAYDRPLRTEGVRYQLQFFPLDPVQLSNQFPASIIGPPNLPVMRVSWNDMR